MSNGDPQQLGLSGPKEPPIAAVVAGRQEYIRGYISLKFLISGLSVVDSPVGCRRGYNAACHANSARRVPSDEVTCKGGDIFATEDEQHLQGLDVRPATVRRG